MASGGQGDVQGRLEELEKMLQLRTQERDAVRTKYESAEIEIMALKQKVDMFEKLPTERMNGEDSGPKDSPQNDDLQKENEELRSLLSNMREMLRDKTEICCNHERRSEALNKQVSSLKEVIGITKDMLGIRNMEVQHLQQDINSMEKKILAERERHNQMLSRMDDAVRLNSELKKEYESQLKIFGDLQEKYNNRVASLVADKEKTTSEKTITVSQETQTCNMDINNVVNNVTVIQPGDTQLAGTSLEVVNDTINI